MTIINHEQNTPIEIYTLRILMSVIKKTTNNHSTIPLKFEYYKQKKKENKNGNRKKKKCKILSAIQKVLESFIYFQ